MQEQITQAGVRGMIDDAIDAEFLVVEGKLPLTFTTTLAITSENLVDDQSANIIFPSGYTPVSVICDPVRLEATFDKEQYFCNPLYVWADEWNGNNIKITIQYQLITSFGTSTENINTRILFKRNT